MRYVIPILALALAAPVLARDKVALTGRVIGEPVNCVRVSDIRDTQRPDDKTIIFELNGKRFYRNELPNRCPRLSSIGTAISYRVTGGQLCSIDLIHVVDTIGGIGDFGACGLGKFVPWQPDKRVDGR